MRTVFLVLILCVFPAGVFAQAKAELITEFGPMPCGHFMSQVDVARMKQQDVPGSKIYVIYYEGRNYTRRAWNKQSKKYEDIRVGPIRGQALNYAKGVGLLLEHTHKFDVRNIVLVDGGYDVGVRLEFWVVPAGAETPKPRPTGVEEKDVNFQKRKVSYPFDCRYAYDYE